MEEGIAEGEMEIEEGLLDQETSHLRWNDATRSRADYLALRVGEQGLATTPMEGALKIGMVEPYSGAI